MPSFQCSATPCVLPPFESFVKKPVIQPEELNNILSTQVCPAPTFNCRPNMKAKIKDPDSSNLNSPSSLPNPTNKEISFGESAAVSESGLSMTHPQLPNFPKIKDAIKTPPAPKRRRGIKKTPFMYESQDVSDLRVWRSKKQKEYREKQREERDQLEKSRSSLIQQCQQLIKIVKEKEETINNLKNENKTLTTKNVEIEAKLQAVAENKETLLVEQQKAIPTPIQTVKLLDLVCDTISQLPKHCEVFFGPQLSEMRVQPLSNNDVQEIREVIRQTERASGLPLIRMTVKLDCEISGELKNEQTTDQR